MILRLMYGYVSVLIGKFNRCVVPIDSSRRQLGFTSYLGHVLRLRRNQRALTMHYKGGIMDIQKECHKHLNPNIMLTIRQRY